MALVGRRGALDAAPVVGHVVAHRGEDAVGHLRGEVAVVLGEAVLAASDAVQYEPPVRSRMAGSAASATTATPLNFGVSPKLMSRPWSSRRPSAVSTVLASRPSVSTSPGHSDTTATPWGFNSKAVSRVTLSIAAFPTPYGTDSR